MCFLVYLVYSIHVTQKFISYVKATFISWHTKNDFFFLWEKIFGPYVQCTGNWLGLINLLKMSETIFNNLRSLELLVNINLPGTSTFYMMDFIFMSKIIIYLNVFLIMCLIPKKF